MQPSHMLMRLNMETRAQHPEADAAWLDMMANDTTRGRYIDQLVATYGFEAPIEAALALTPQMTNVIQLRPRARSGFIVQDLLTLGLTPSKIARLPQCSQIVPFRDPVEALGWMYVIERATLLHDSVRRHLESRLPYVNAWSYLSVYDGVAGMRWQDLGTTLDHAVVNPAVADQMLAAARAAFACQRDWCATEPALAARA